MRIRECGCDDKIVLSKFKFNCDEIDKSIPDPLPQNLNHFLLIVGKPGSSKTTLLLNLICKRGKMYNKKFDRIYLFSPSLGTIEDCPFEELSEDQKYEELTEEILEGVRNGRVEGALGEHAKVWYGYWGSITASRNAFRWLTGLSSAQVGVLCVP